MELAMLERIIAADSRSAQLLSVRPMAALARRAAQLVASHNIDLDSHPAWTPEQQAFRQWHRAWREEMRDAAWVADADLAGALDRKLRAGEVSAPARIELVGHFPQATPAIAGLFDALAAAGCEVRQSAPAAPAAQIDAAILPDTRSQFRDLASCCANWLDASPEARIIIALPDPDARRDVLTQRLREALAPNEVLVDAPQARWAFGRAASAAEMPEVAAALDLARLSAHGNRYSEVAGLLLSPLLWEDSERVLLAEVDIRLRRQGGDRFPMREWMASLPEQTPAGLRERLDALQATIEGAPRRALPSAWGENWDARRQALELAPDCQAWVDALAQLAAMDRILGEVPARAAQRWLEEILTAGGPGAATDAPVRIVDLDTAATLRADHLIVADADNRSLPAEPLAMPLIATELLAAAGVVAVSANGRLKQARELVRALKAVAPSLSLRCSAISERSEELKPCALFDARWSLVAGHASTHSPAALEPVVETVPPVDEEERRGIRGGSTIFRDFFEAPFFALCRARLGIDVLPEIPNGISAAVQGNLAHAVLEELVRDHPRQTDIAALDHAELAARTEAGVARHIPRHLPPSRFGRALQRLELGRQTDLILQWLEHEQRRLDPYTAIAFELPLKTRIAGLSLNLTIDRIDEVETAGGPRYLVIDYKTGAELSTNPWDAETLKEPQLPLYATLSAGADGAVPHVDGICFAHLVDGHPAFVAATNWRERLIEESDGPFHTDWDGQLAAWQAALEDAARRFLAGEAGIDPDAKYERRHQAGLRRLVRFDHD